MERAAAMMYLKKKTGKLLNRELYKLKASVIEQIKRKYSGDIYAV